jgi:hypothetical protein
VVRLGVMAGPQVHSRLGDLRSVAAAFGWTAEGQVPPAGVVLDRLDPDTRAIFEPILNARSLPEFYKAKLAILSDRRLIERLLRNLLEEGRQQAKAARQGNTDVLLPEVATL